MLVYKGLNRVFIHNDIEKIRQLIESDYDVFTSNHANSNVSYKVEKYLAATGLSDLLDIINCFISFIMILFYIISTYTYPDEGNDTFIMLNNLANTIEIFLCIYLISHLALRVYTSQNRIFYIFSLESLVDSGTIIAILLAKQTFIPYDYQYYLRFFRMVRIFSFFRLENIFQRRANEAVRYTYKLIIYIVAIIFLSTGLILELENQAYRQTFLASNSSDQSGFSSIKGVFSLYQFHDMFYYMIVTLGTIGYGDITPSTDLGRFAIIVTILVMLAVIPPLTQKLLTILQITSKYSRLSYNKIGNDTKHLIILGSVGKEGLDAFLSELYHEDHGNLEHHTVIMQSNFIKKTQMAIQESDFSNKIFYLVGNSLIHKDLARCKSDSAECVVLLANKLAKDPKYEDFSNILQAFSVKKFSKIYAKKEMRVCIQLLRPESKELYYSSLLDDDDLNSKDQIICVEELKLQLLGKSCICPGINTIISSLITSQKPSRIEEGEVLSEDTSWRKEYLAGMQNEIYRINMKAEIVQGLKYMNFVKIIYEIFGIIVIGVDVILDDHDPFLCLNPSSYIFSPFDHYIYIIADKMPDPGLINKHTGEYFNKRFNERDEVIKLLRLKNPSWELMRKMRREKENNKKDIESEGNLGKRSDKLYMTKSKQKDIGKNFFDNFFRTALPRTQYEAENFSHDNLNNHIIVCGLLQNMKNLIYPLRATSIKNHQYPILIMDKQDHIPSEIWKEIQYFPDIFYMQGNPIKSKDLHRAGVKKAKAVIILGRNNFEVESHEMIDADTIFIYKAIRNENKNVLIIADLISISTIGYISSTDQGSMDKQEYRLSEQFAVGEIYTGSMLDTLVCQTFFNQYICDILQQLILGSAYLKYSHNHIKLLEERKISQSTLYLLSIRDELEKMGWKIFSMKMSFKDLFNRFAEANMVPIGIFRNSKINGLNTPNPNSQKSTKVEKYVYLAPNKDTLIDIEHDKIYVLTIDDEGSSANNVENHREKENVNQKNLKLIKHSNKLANNIIESMRNIISAKQESLKNHLSIRKIVDTTRTALRNELIEVFNFAAKPNEEDSESKGDSKNKSSNALSDYYK